MSIILVVIHHLNLKNGLLNGLWHIPGMDPVLFFIQDGHLGVNVFFVISGFLITSLMINEENVSQTISLKKFYIRRTLRIFPAYYFMLFVYLILQLLHVIHIDTASWLAAVTYTKCFDWSADWYTAHAWSLSIEELFYLCWPLIFLGGKNIRKIIPFVLILMVPFLRIYVNQHPSPLVDNLSCFTRIDAIATGCLFAIYRERILRFLRPCFTLMFYVSLAGLIAFPYLPMLANKVHLAYIFIPLGVTHGTIGNFFIAIILMYSVFGPQRIWFRFLNLRLMNYIGLLSYSIYLWQEIFISGNDWWVAGMPQNIFCIVLAALCSYYFIEKPFSRLRSRFAAPE